MYIPTRTHLTYNNNKPWFTAKLRQLRQAKNDAYRKGDKCCINRPNTHWKRRSEWKRGIIMQTLRIKFQWFCFSVEKSERHHQLQDTMLQHSGESITGRRSEWVLLQVWKNTIHTSCNPPLPHTCTADKRRKAPGPDSVSPACLKTCTDQLATIFFTQIFNRSLELCEVPSWDCTTSSNIWTNQGLMQGSCLWTSAPLSTPSSRTPLNKLTQLSVPTSICQWIPSFLTDRLVRLGELTSNTRTINTGAPQGCVLSPLLFSLDTNDCTSNDPSVKLLKFADDTTFIGLIQDRDESAYRQEVEQLSFWCSHSNLELNTLKTVEMIVDFSRRMQRTVRAAERIIGVLLPSLQDLYNSRVKKRAGNIIIDPSHPGHNLFALLPSGRRYRALCTRTSRHKNCHFALLTQCSTTKPQEHIHIFIYSCI